MGPAVGHQVEGAGALGEVETDIDVISQGDTLVAIVGGASGREGGVCEESGGEGFVNCVEFLDFYCVL